MSYQKIWCVFQPHTYSRTKALMDEFAQALSLADEVVLADIYAARETDTLGVSSQMLAEKIQEMGVPAHYLGDFEKIEEFLYTHCLHDELLITMGAGDVVKIGEKLVKQ
jgi:UDP-N-acetylmuramate--alanine ligase